WPGALEHLERLLAQAARAFAVAEPARDLGHVEPCELALDRVGVARRLARGEDLLREDLGAGEVVEAQEQTGQVVLQRDELGVAGRELLLARRDHLLQEDARRRAIAEVAEDRRQVLLDGQRAVAVLQAETAVRREQRLVLRAGAIE